MPIKNKTIQQSLHEIACCLGENIDNINNTLQQINTTLHDEDNDVSQVTIAGDTLIVTYEDATSQTFNIPCTCENSPDLVTDVEFLDLITPIDGILDTMRVTYGDGTITDYPLKYIYNIVEASDHSSFTMYFSDGTSTTININRVTDVTLSGNDLVIQYQDGTTQNLTVLCPGAFVDASFDSNTGDLTLSRCNGLNPLTLTIPVASGTAGIANVYMINKSTTTPVGTNTWGVIYPNNYDTVVGAYTSNNAYGIEGINFNYFVRRHFDYYCLAGNGGLCFEGGLLSDSVGVDLNDYMPTISANDSLDYQMYLNPDPNQTFTPGYVVKADDSPGVKDYINLFQINLFYILYKYIDDHSTIYKIGQLKHVDPLDDGVSPENTPSIEFLDFIDNATPSPSWVLTFKIRNVSGNEGYRLAILSFEVLYALKEVRSS